ncbi:MAG: helical backbone metal receptor [Candidatus Omnitrophica bacterium]|nr:helical backbone metal receptor [Candidatus Omnitrophota bacterium]
MNLRLTVRAKFITCVFMFLAACVFTGHAEENYPQRMISLGPSITKDLYLLGAGDKLIADTTYCVKPPEAERKEKIGTVLEVNVEKVFNLKPDLVLATSLTNPKAKEKLKNLGIRVVTFPAPRDFSSLCSQFLELGKLIGVEEEAEEIVENARNKAASIREKIKNLPKPKVFIQIGARPLFAATGRYFVNDYVEFAGGLNIAKEAREGIYSREQVLKADPDVIIIAAMGSLRAEVEKKAWQNFQTLNAVKFNRIYIIDSDELTSPTPVSFTETLEEFVDILHPGVKCER